MLYFYHQPNMVDLSMQSVVEDYIFFIRSRKGEGAASHG